MDSGSRPPGSLKVLEIIQDHGPELAYDFRSRFNLSIEDIGGTISLKEAAYLISVLLRETDSWLQASINDWKFPVNRTWIVTADYFDTFVRANSKQKPKPYPRPWPNPGTTRIGKKKQDSKSVLRKLDLMNPKENDGG